MTNLLALPESQPLWVTALGLIAAMALAALLGFLARRLPGSIPEPSSQASTILGGGLGLLGLLLGFSLSMAVGFFEQRRTLVIDEANAIGTAYLRAQFLDEPHRARMSGLLARYVDNRILLAEAPAAEVPALLATNDGLLAELWAATLVAAPTVAPPVLASPLVTAVNELIDDDLKRKAARLARVPSELFMMLFVVLIAISAMLGHFTQRPVDRIEGGVLLLIIAIASLLVLDINLPKDGFVREDQRPMRLLQESIRAGPAVYDRYRDRGAPAPAG